MDKGQSSTVGTTASRVGKRFDYVKYDDKATADQTDFKTTVVMLECEIEDRLSSPRAKALALTKLEEVYMWIGKAIRDDQVARNGSAPLQEQRTDS